MTSDRTPTHLPILRNLTHTPLSVVVHSPPTPALVAKRSRSSRHTVHGLIDPNRPDLEVTFRLPRRRGWRRTVETWEEVNLRARRRECGRSVGDEKVPLLEKPSKFSRSGEIIVLPFRVYTKTLNDDLNTPILLILPRVDPARHISDMPDSTSIADLILPGTHESMARYGWPISQCQHPTSTLLTQLTQGIRYFDIRLRLKSSRLMTYHGPWPQLTSFQSILQDISDFLHSNPRETLIVCVQQETAAHPDFSRTVRDEMRPYIDEGGWFLDPRVPTLGQVRGKAILMSRFGGGSGSTGSGPWEVPRSRGPGGGGGEEMEVRMGWRPNRWPDSELEGFTWDCGDTTVWTQDWYDIYGVFNIPAKFSILTDHIRSTSHLPSTSNLTLSFSSAGSIPLALPTVVAKGFGWPDWGLGWRGVNELVRDWLLDRLVGSEEEGLQRPEGSESSGSSRSSSRSSSGSSEGSKEVRPAFPDPTSKESDDPSTNQYLNLSTERPEPGTYNQQQQRQPSSSPQQQPPSPSSSSSKSSTTPRLRGIIPMDYYDSGGVVDVMLGYNNVIRGEGRVMGTGTW